MKLLDAEVLRTEPARNLVCPEPPARHRPRSGTKLSTK